MNSLGKIQNSMLSTTVENSIALCNFNFDFSLRKVEVPHEYTEIGRVLTSSRRTDAEEGRSHRTARKLGCLFEGLIPSTPKLISAYGLRVSEILQAPGINPKGTAADGPFQDFVGADCTSIWAAATSGPAAIGIHLLACMLAKAWDAKSATAIWVELVAARKREIGISLKDNLIVNELALVASQQDITREELAVWDASARSWNERAYQAKRVQHDQFLLIVKNVSLPFGPEKAIYENVIGAWSRAMECLERHLNGFQQRVSDGAVLLALSAWHLFPDLVFFGDQAVSVKFADPLLPKNITMTLGLQISEAHSRKDIRWSLALSHLRYYGDPVTVLSNEDSSRLSPIHLNIIALGSVIGSWQVGKNVNEAMTWLDGLWTYIQDTAISFGIAVDSSPHTSWLSCLALASREVLSANGDKSKNLQALLRFGQRRARRFLNKEEKEFFNQIPYFGLCNTLVLSCLRQKLDIDCGIHYLRQISAELGLGSTEAIILYSQYTASGRILYRECATALPHTRYTRDRFEIGNMEKEDIHARWISLSPVKGPPQICEHPCHRDLNSNNDWDGPIDIDFRVKSLKANGEQCIILPPDCLPQIFKNSSSSSKLHWCNTPMMFDPRLYYKGCERVEEEDGFCPCFKSSGKQTASFDIFLEEYDEDYQFSLRLLIRDTIGLENRSTLHDLKRKLLKATRSLIDPKEGLALLQESGISKVRVWDYLQSFSCLSKNDRLKICEEALVPKGLDWTFSHGRSATFITKTVMIPPPVTWFTSLEALNVVSEIYSNIPSALISISSVFQPLSDALWIPISEFDNPDLVRGSSRLLNRMTRERSFACIAMFQTGGKNLDPADFGEVMAICWENSIFVAGLLLSDPYLDINPRDIRHIVGNIGHPGLTLLISPRGPLRIRPLSNDYRVVIHEPYDYKREDNFRDTSLHLSFTDWKMPLVNVQHESNTVDQDVFFLESVISLWENGNWTADLDIMGINNSHIDRIPAECAYTHDTAETKETSSPGAMCLTSLDKWEELLDAPGTTAVMKARGNWAARLSAVALLTQLEKGHCLSIVGENLCWDCICARYADPEPHLPDFIID